MVRTESLDLDIPASATRPPSRQDRSPKKPDLLSAYRLRPRLKKAHHAKGGRPVCKGRASTLHFAVTVRLDTPQLLAP
jgi:hypothetical protein